MKQYLLFIFNSNRTLGRELGSNLDMGLGLCAIWTHPHGTKPTLGIRIGWSYNTSNIGVHLGGNRALINIGSSAICT